MAVRPQFIQDQAPSAAIVDRLFDPTPLAIVG